MKRIIDSTLVILSLMLIFGCKESKVGQGNPTKDSMSIDTDSVISGKVFTKQDIASEDTLNAVIRTQSPKSKDFDFEVFIMRGEKTVQIIPFSYQKYRYPAPKYQHSDVESVAKVIGHRTESDRAADGI